MIEKMNEKFGSLMLVTCERNLIFMYTCIYIYTTELQ